MIISSLISPLLSKYLYNYDKHLCDYSKYAYYFDFKVQTGRLLQ